LVWKETKIFCVSIGVFPEALYLA